MAVRIEKVSVQNLGPLPDFTMEMGLFNLVYGQNETGKTYLVEFILRSVFRHASQWALRAPIGRGSVVVSGVTPDPIQFTPDAKQKLEDYWDQDERGLPTNMATLLVVKGAELAMVREEPGGINRAILKSYLSRDMLLDQILSKIPATIRKARVAERTIDGERRGGIKSRLERQGDLERIDRLFAQIDEHYSGGDRRRLELKKEALEQEVNELRRARLHLAYTIHQEIKELERKREDLPEAELSALENDFRDYQRLLGQLAQKEQQQEALARKSQDYAWVQEAIRIWESRKLERAAGPKPILLFFGAGALLASFVTALIAFKLPAILFFALGLVLVGLYIRGLHRQLHASVETDELNRLAEDFEQRFGEKLSSLAELKRREAALQAPHFKAQNLEEECDALRAEIEGLATAIGGRLQAITGKEHSIPDWEEVISSLRRAADELDRQIDQKELELAKLGVDEADYLAAETAVKFDASRLERLEAELDEVDQQLQETQRDLASLKQSICSETGDEISTPWPDLLDRLRHRRQEVSDEYRDLTAQILAQIAVSEVLEDIRAHEDEKIRDGLKAKVVKTSLHRITGQYDGLDLEEDQLIVSSPYGSYLLQDLSTGTQEQVLLALRMGFASMLTGGEPLFLVLDDAFQHSDWRRRERLVEEVVNLAKQDWQIIYLTMDDHLRDLLREAGEREFKRSFSYRSL